MSTSDSYTQIILVTGGCGFIGSWFIDILLSPHSSYPGSLKVICLDKITYSGNIKNISQHFENPHFHFIEGDICEYDLVRRVIKIHHVTQVVNFAAESCVDKSFLDPLLFSRSNIIGTQTLLEVIRKEFTHQVNLILHISTDEVYGEQSSSEESVLESNKLNPTNPYSASKAAADLIINSYLYSYKLPFKIVRMNNVYGPRQYPEKIVPNFLTSLINHQHLTLFGDGTHTRKYLYVTDAVNAIMLVMLNGQIGEIYNVGTNFEISNIELTKRIIDVYKEQVKGGEVVRDLSLDTVAVFTEGRLYDDERYDINYDKLLALGWKERISFDDGLRETASWYIANTALPIK